MQRKAVRRRVLPGIAMLTALAAGAAGLTGCTSGSGGGSTSDSKAGGSAAAPAQPGKYRSLPSPCKAGADSKKLKGMLPAGDSLTPEQRDQMYAGVADASYDGDRHVGCRWTGQSPEETRLLSVGFERVVSYDRTASSDDDKAKQVYVRRLTDAKLPFPGPTASPTPAAPAPGAPGPAAPTPAAPAQTAPAPGAPVSPSASPSAPVELGSRVLEGLGGEAFLEDKLSPAGASAAQSRTVRIVFRTSNVIVTIEYSVQPALPGTVPPSTETQESARQLADALAERFSE
ncbi:MULTISPECIES: DUF3558 domain-containing protein [Streptomyces]|uniref:DUF3558 domain-containing protein n=1 Tax=Streptomyces TaxID=1883 RepID=UPI001F1D8CA6|nr:MULTISPECIES: DUF3558 domain-containing protein [Streptomyces]MCM9081076.1 DUF3558 domain-containing protein [Streptomyces spororaveus]MCX5304477.1 DUF3558 domain-containing protein [Streptomyces sp. NBC_00160]